MVAGSVYSSLRKTFVLSKGRSMLRTHSVISLPDFPAAASRLNSLRIACILASTSSSAPKQDRFGCHGQLG